MTNRVSQISDLHRPRILVRAARAGVMNYNRNRDLRRLTRMETTPSPDEAIGLLLAEEDRVETIRRAGDAGYSFTRHIELLIAMMAEMRLLPRLDPV